MTNNLKDKLIVGSLILGLPGMFALNGLRSSSEEELGRFNVEREEVVVSEEKGFFWDTQYFRHEGKLLYNLPLFDARNSFVFNGKKVSFQDPEGPYTITDAPDVAYLDR